MKDNRHFKRGDLFENERGWPILLFAVAIALLVLLARDGGI